MFDKILIANRGEIAVRVMRACGALGIRTVAVYSEADREALHVRMADEAHPCGGARATESYLDSDRMLEITKRCGAQAIHPGYGFLSENAEFAEACQAESIVFIGPPAGVIRAMGDKITARQQMTRAGVPIVPGAIEALDEDGVARIALEIGFPLMVKASAGGGGRGLRLVSEEAELSSAIERARSEAEQAFGDGALYIEKALARSRHIEVQILADAHGQVVHLGERECSIQRLHQTLIEEAPAPGLSESVRQRLCETAVQAARAVDYRGVGTIEFLVDETDAFYFLEMNTRIQVEHAITEEITGVDLLVEMIRVAAGEPMSCSQSDIAFRGHAIEARLYAEDPDKNFMPSPGRITLWRPAEGPGVRVDSGVEAGSDVSVHYDPMLAKLIVWAPTRAAAIIRLRLALLEFRVAGVRTSLPFHLRAIEVPAFMAGEYATDFVAKHMGKSAAATPDQTATLCLVAALELAMDEAVARGAAIRVGMKGGQSHAFHVAFSGDAVSVQVDDQEREVDARRLSPGRWSVIEAGEQCEYLVERRGKSGVEVMSSGIRHVFKFEGDPPREVPSGSV